MISGFSISGFSISWRSCVAFVYINGFVVGLATALHTCLSSSVWVSTFVKNGAVLWFLHYNTHAKEKIQTAAAVAAANTRSSNPGWDLVLFVTTTCMQAATHGYLLQGGFGVANGPGVAFFLPRLLMFEVLLDLGHYVAHRLLHAQRWLYPVHKWHHHYTRPTLLNTFYHHPLDLLLLDCLPTVGSMMVLHYGLLGGGPVFTPLQFQAVLVYKTFVEVAGHTGKRSVPTGSFPLCIWLPRFLGISLYTEDHELHHRVGHCNYGKRFSLWDRVFGTYVPFFSSHSV